MKRSGILILSLLLTALSCGPRADIPKKQMIEIYYEISLLDSYVDHNPEMRAQSDSMKVYAPLLDKYGYTEEEFINSINFYLGDPVRFLKIIEAVETKLKEREQYLSDLQRADGIEDERMIEEAVAFDEGAPVEEYPAFEASDTLSQESSAWESPVMESPVKDTLPNDTIVRELPDTKNRRITTREKRVTREELIELSKKFKEQKSK